MKKIDRVILAVIALALTVIALNPWVAPTSSQAQSGKMDVNIVEVDGHRLAVPKMDLVPGRFGPTRPPLPGIPVIILNK